ncbi:hypothetical protein FA15DRAFT_660207 [Coprinopsis marcescibilis]|uniref:Uncharacterized protein n=1 Tax=Coprinopsis marcescibilis TaxID=230819 RepID=A0A5C3KGW8_COPMA|nr:hypothetical protein FA15DRAFT_660207 [Coprinopsis marcescibilis]
MEDSRASRGKSGGGHAGGGVEAAKAATYVSVVKDSVASCGQTDWLHGPHETVAVFAWNGAAVMRLGACAQKKCHTTESNCRPRGLVRARLRSTTHAGKHYVSNSNGGTDYTKAVGTGVSGACAGPRPVENEWTSPIGQMVGAAIDCTATSEAGSGGYSCRWVETPKATTGSGGGECHDRVSPAGQTVFAHVVQETESKADAVAKGAIAHATMGRSSRGSMQMRPYGSMVEGRRTVALRDPDYCMIDFRIQIPHYSTFDR